MISETTSKIRPIIHADSFCFGHVKMAKKTPELQFRSLLRHPQRYEDFPKCIFKVRSILARCLSHSDKPYCKRKLYIIGLKNTSKTTEGFLA